MLYAILKPIILAIGRVWLRVSAVGTELVPRDGPLLLASNHSSLLDPPLIGCVLPRELDYMAKTELFRIPGLRAHQAAQRASGGSDGVGSAALRLALRLLGDGRAVLVFPEGTRSADGRLGPAHAGAGMLAALSGAPVLPVYIQGSGRALPRGAVVPRPVQVTVRFGAQLRFARERGRSRYQEVSD
jgi:1-acyl-sn-glycerol-3-phosphate acyltransferase